MAAPAELPRVLAQRARTAADRVAYEFAAANGTITTLTHAELYRRACRVAGRILRHQEGARRPVIILYPPGPSYVVAVHAALLAGSPAVPAYPPDPQRPGVSRQRLHAMATDLGAATVLAEPDVAAESGALSSLVPEESLQPDHRGDGHGPRLPTPTADDPAFVQYTSGSTSAPRGVIVRHRNLQHNMRAIATYFGAGEDARAVMWLPPYHDMGLIGGILTPLFIGFPVRLMTAFDFLKRPLSWLRHISDFGATMSGGPSFAYDLCARRPASAAELAGLDLSRWRVAFNGAEPVRSGIMEAFASKFAASGFRRGAFFPCYGLAEATLIVSGEHWDGRVDEAGRVSCGKPLPDQVVIVADRETGRPVADATEGEILISGPSVTDGYWTEGGCADLFAEHDGCRFLRTGDIGYLAGGRLVITGRTKDVLVHCGMNYHAIDIEEAAVAGSATLRPFAAAFLAGKADGGEAVIVVEERNAIGSPEETAAGVRERVLAATGLPLDAVVVGPPGTVPRTSSGKVQRSLSRSRYVADEYRDLIAFRRRPPKRGLPLLPAPGSLI